MVVRVGEECGGDDEIEDARAMSEVARRAAEAGANVVSGALNVNSASTVTFKASTADLVTETDTASERAIVGVLNHLCPTHAILGEESGVSVATQDDETAFDFLWVVDPLDGTTNFAHRYPSFGVSVALLKRGRVFASCVVEFCGGPGCWSQRVYVAGRGIGATMNDAPLRVSDTLDVRDALLCTGFGYEHLERWEKNLELFKHFTDVSRGVRRLGAASVDLCLVALGVLDCYWELDCKAWDWAAGALVVAEAGGAVTSFAGEEWKPFARTIVASNGVASLHDAVIAQTKSAAASLEASGVSVGLWHTPTDYPADFL